MAKSVDVLQDSIELGKTADGDSVGLAIHSMQSLFIQASSGSGKSWLVRRLVEQIYGKIQIIIIDADGEYGTLREKYDFVLAGKGGDVACDSRTAKALTLMLLEKGVSAILDVSELSLATGAKQDYVKIVAETLINAPVELRHPVVFIVDEVHLFATEQGKGEASSTVAMIDVCARGRKRGIIPIFATQRMAKVSKDAIAELKNYLIGGTMLDSDVKRAIEHLGIEGHNKATFSKQIRLLDPGEFWALGRAITRVPLLFRVGSVETSHPKVGQYTPPVQVPVNIQKLLPSFAELVEQAVDDGMSSDELREEITRLKEELAVYVDADGPCNAVQNTVREMTFEEMRSALQSEIDVEFESKAREMVRPLWKWVKDVYKTVSEITPPPKLVLPRFDADASTETPSFVLEPPPTETAKAVSPKAFVPTVQYAGTKPDTGLNKGMIKMLAAAAAWYPKGLTEVQVAMRSGIKNGGSTFRQYRAALMAGGYIIKSSEKWFVSIKGLNALGGRPAAPQSQQDAIAFWDETLNKGQSTLLRIIVDNRKVELVDLANKAGIVPGGSTFRQYMAVLKATGLVSVVEGNALLNRIELP